MTTPPGEMAAPARKAPPGRPTRQTATEAALRSGGRSNQRRKRLFGAAEGATSDGSDPSGKRKEQPATEATLRGSGRSTATEATLRGSGRSNQRRKRLFGAAEGAQGWAQRRKPKPLKGTRRTTPVPPSSGRKDTPPAAHAVGGAVVGSPRVGRPSHHELER